MRASNVELERYLDDQTASAIQSWRRRVSRCRYLVVTDLTTMVGIFNFASRLLMLCRFAIHSKSVRMAHGHGRGRDEVHPRALRKTKPPDNRQWLCIEMIY